MQNDIVRSLQNQLDNSVSRRFHPKTGRAVALHNQTRVTIISQHTGLITCGDQKRSVQTQTNRIWRMYLVALGVCFAGQVQESWRNGSSLPVGLLALVVLGSVEELAG